ncbi:4Fe-4S ferredoxin iron-sulfur binding domain-containing protein [Gottschalkia acidurici 9a]|uniref:4Fe-4S ferredoxin iron-sulfur binding domain-containing protein n=1 Tax=Gottschalkia acidurici (strain ATCC 7906 / DSM 604 / BCRC 14475 / CIP 104303 / KCTC 5404 / NCIMB 10678 / 9a) TaxID=1128398 RepID=K0B3P8_GOTA9|nr:EFR1 family ferrodoxin [Gottschalkia acidurici]AFS79772.1 4Fe-4S ferredoxin iron-sulfur binding domain-containing protein [Gottschalkia acidurici 9a]
MKTLIIYYSGSGNTKHGVELIKMGIEKDGINTCQIVKIDDLNNNIIENYDLVGFASPIYGFKPAFNIMKLIKNLKKESGKPCFTFTTHAGEPANSDLILFDSLKERGFNVINQSNMECEDSWTFIRKVGKTYEVQRPTKEKQNSIYELGEKLSNIFDENKLSSQTVPRPKFNFCWQHLVSKTFIKMFLPFWFVTKVDTSKCTKCSLCVNTCPTGRMNIETFPRVNGECIGCNGCINICPNDAVIGLGTRGKEKYKGIPINKKIIINKKTIDR